ncbi:metallophosphoesterase [Chryseosolibacter indicus]|uniref:Metallophosphoesterase family protein n=1 Tax=Chryseosolibacter indicus TaxID=2782351 RepID=A0ABS5VRQ6_9BACT|nr:metallophosphoesterase [Chryseosolibacter indicus]MBT1704127.1 metallophosphoesterase family protein [Chryseosolibacter indicus]
MQALLRFLLYRPIMWLIERFSSAPDAERIFSSLDKLKRDVEQTPGKKGFIIPFEISTSSFVVFSDQHKGRRNGADDFTIAEPNYLAALAYYNENKFHLISLGDSEELWENTMLQVMKHNKATFEAEKNFLARNAFTKIFGNHDLDYDIDPLAPVYLKEIYNSSIAVLEAVILQTKIEGKTLNIFCTHGHQGDLQSDGNWFSKFFVSKIWAPLQAYLKINPNTPAYDKELKTTHNRMMYEWSSQQKDLILITGHTHQPVFESLTHLERLHRTQKQALYDHNKEWAEALDLQIAWQGKNDNHIWEDYLQMRPTYFNTGCCCFSDGDITGIEITDGFIRLIKWEFDDNNISKRVVLEELSLKDLITRI